MSVTFSVGQTPRRLGGLLSLSVRLLLRTRPLLRIAALTMLPLAALQIALAAMSTALPLIAAVLLGSVLETPALAAVSILGAFATIVPYLALPWMEGALAYRVIEESLGSTGRGVRASYRAAGGRWPALFASSVLRQFVSAMLVALAPTIFRLTNVLLVGDESIGLQGDGTLAAGVLAVCAPIGLVAGIFLLRALIDWSLRAPVIVAEGVGVFAALGRSAALVRGQRWAMLGRLAPLALLNLVFVVLPSMPMVAWLAMSDAPAWLTVAAPLALCIGAVAWIFVAPLESIFLTLCYLDLRVRREDLLADLAAAAAVEARPATTDAADFDAAIVFPSTPAQRVIALQRRLRHDGESCPLWIDLAAAYQEVGDLGAALDALERARALPCADPQVLLAIAGVHRLRRDASAARAALREYIDANPSDAAVHLDGRWRGLLDEDGKR